MNLKIKLIALIVATGVYASAQKVNVKKAMKAAIKQTDVLVKHVGSARIAKPTFVSPRTVENVQFKMVISRDWTSGFFPSQLWYFYDYTKDSKFICIVRISYL